MHFWGHSGIFFIFASILVFLSCSKVTRERATDSLTRNIIYAQERVKANPTDVGAITDLGVLYYQAGQFSRALRLFAKALELNPDYTRAVCYIGLTLEAEHKPNDASKVYAIYPKFSPSSPYYHWLKGRSLLLKRERQRQALVARLRLPKDTGKKTLRRTTIAVFPFTYHGDNPIYVPLRKGLADLLVRDLSQVPKLKVVERWKIQVLLDEISRSAEFLTNQNTTIRISKLFGAGTAVRSAYNVLDDEILIVDVSHWNLLTEKFPTSTTHADKFENLIYLEKEVFLNILEKMNIIIPPEAYQIVTRLPTENWEAFLAYATGLEKEDERNYGEALIFYEKALELDPKFKLSEEKIKEIRLLALAQQPPPGNFPGESSDSPNSQSLQTQKTF